MKMKKIVYPLIALLIITTLVMPVAANVPLIITVTASRDPINENWIVLSINIRHDGGAPDHKVTAIYLIINGSEYHAPIMNDLNTSEFVYNYTVIDVYGPTNVKIRAFCERDGWGPWWEGIAYPNGTLVQLSATPSVKLSYDIIVVVTGVVASIVIALTVHYRAKRLG